MKPLLSILIPTVPSRALEQAQLFSHLHDIGGDVPAVEVLSFSDNRRRSIGAKRQALLDMARGEYVAFCDDDDWVADHYFAELLPRCESGPDVVTFEQIATINCVEGRIVFDATCRVDEPWKPHGIARRRPWHVCAWKRSLAQRGLFTEINYGEDAAWVAQVAPLARTTLHIPRVLHYYRHDAKTTLAPA